MSTFFILFLSIPGSFSRNKSHTIIQNCKKLFQSNLSKKFIYTWQDINEFQLTINRCCSDNCPKKNLESSQESTIDSAQLLVTFTKTGLQSRNLVEQLCYKPLMTSSVLPKYYFKLKLCQLNLVYLKFMNL